MWRTFCLYSLLLCVSQSISAATNVVQLTSLEWPPYTGEQLPEQGFSTAVVRAAFAAEGVELRVGFYPWSRAVLLAKQENSGYHGYFPEYFATTVATQFLFSAPIGDSPLGIAYNIAHPVSWQTTEDLRRYTIGIVQDYVNTTEFDRNVAQGLQSVEIVSTDWQNVKKLAAGHLRAAIIDANVLHFLLQQHQATPYRVVHMHPRLLENKPLYVCLRKGDSGLRVQQILSAGLRKIDVPQIIAQWHARHRLTPATPAANINVPR